MTLEPTVAARTDIGQVRARNEDAFAVDEALGLFAIADGMGGHQAGDVASALALDVLKSEIQSQAGELDAEALAHAVLNANEQVFQESLARGHVQGMGTTLTAMLWQAPGRVLLAHVGDSRCYLWREDRLSRLTKDHSWVQVQIDEGLLSEDEAVKHPMRNVVTRSIGFEQRLDVDTLAMDARPGDVFLLATDGLTGKLRDYELADELKRTVDADALDAVLDTLVSLANQRGGEDNITAVLVRVDTSAKT